MDQLIGSVYLFFIWKGTSLVVQVATHVTLSIVLELNHTKCQFVLLSWTELHIKIFPTSIFHGFRELFVDTWSSARDFHNVHIIMQSLLVFWAYYFLNILISNLTFYHLVATANLNYGYIITLFCVQLLISYMLPLSFVKSKGC